MKAMWKFSTLIIVIYSLLFVGGTEPELMCHQKGDYCQVKEPVVAEKVPGTLEI